MEKTLEREKPATGERTARRPVPLPTLADVGRGCLEVSRAVLRALASGSTNDPDIPFIPPASLAEKAGLLAGIAIAPIGALGSWLRRARVLHPEGACYSAKVTPLVREGPLAWLASRLEGDALVRLSSGVWRGRELPDILGCAIRFVSSPDATGEAHPGDQDLLLETFPRIWLSVLAPLWTDTSDFLKNIYFGAGVFDVGSGERVRFRLVPVEKGAEGRDRLARIDGAVHERTAAFRLEAQRLTGRRRWTPVARIGLDERVPDSPRLEFSPFRAGRGIFPRGFLQFTRLAAYPASQRARPARARPVESEKVERATRAA